MISASSASWSGCRRITGAIAGRDSPCSTAAQRHAWRGDGPTRAPARAPEASPHWYQRARPAAGGRPCAPPRKDIPDGIRPRRIGAYPAAPAVARHAAGRGSRAPRQAVDRDPIRKHLGGPRVQPTVVRYGSSAPAGTSKGPAADMRATPAGTSQRYEPGSLPSRPRPATPANNWADPGRLASVSWPLQWRIAACGRTSSAIAVSRRELGVWRAWLTGSAGALNSLG
jgi:hypothetical protein